MSEVNQTKVLVLGAGAMGCLLGGLLAEGGKNNNGESGLDVTFLDAWEEHIVAIQKNGMKLSGEGGERVLTVKAVFNDQEGKNVSSLGKFDIIICQTKALHTKVAVESVKHCFDDNTVCVSFQNGLGNEDIIAEVLQDMGGSSRVFGGQTLQGANVQGPGHVKIHTDLESVMGEWNCGFSDRCGKLCEAFTKAGLPTKEVME